MWFNWLLWTLNLSTAAGESVHLDDPPPTIELYLKYGADLLASVLWTNEVGDLVDFTGASARWRMVIDDQGDILGLSTTASAFGSLTLGTYAGGTPGRIQYQILKPATTALAAAYEPCLFGATTARGNHSLYVDWADGTSTCLFRGPFYLSPGAE